MAANKLNMFNPYWQKVNEGIQNTDFLTVSQKKRTRLIEESNVPPCQVFPGKGYVRLE